MKVLIIVLLVFIALRYLLPKLLSLVVKRMLKKYSGQQFSRFENNDFHHQNQYRNEGDVTIDDSNVNKKSSYSGKGEYVDFE